MIGYYSIENQLKRFLVSFRPVEISMVIWSLFLFWQDQGNEIDDINSERYKPDLMAWDAYICPLMHA